MLPDGDAWRVRRWGLGGGRFEPSTPLSALAAAGKLARERGRSVELYAELDGVEAALVVAVVHPDGTLSEADNLARCFDLDDLEPIVSGAELDALLDHYVRAWGGGQVRYA